MAVFGEALASEYWAIAPDLRGYGASRTQQPFEMVDHLDDLQAMLDRLQIQRGILLGWSLGGILAMELAVRQPERWDGLILVATAARPVGNHPPITALDNVNTAISGILNWLVPGNPIAIEWFGKRSLFRYLLRQHTPETYGYLARAAVPAYLQTSQHANGALARALRQRYSCLEAVAQLTLPALVLAGESDLHIAATASRETAEALVNGEYREYADTAHLFPWEVPTQVQQDVLSWLRKRLRSQREPSSGKLCDR